MIEWGLELLMEVVTTWNTRLEAFGAALRPTGLRLLAIIGVIAVSWMGIKAALQGKPLPELIGEVVVLAITYGFVIWIVRDLDGIIRPLVAGFDHLALVVHRELGSGSSSGEAPLAAALKGLMSAVMSFDIGAQAGAPEEGWFSSLFNRGIEGMTASVLVWLMRFFMSLVLLSMAIAYLATYMIAQSMIFFAVLMAPILVPFYLIAPLRFLAEGWFRFLLAAGFQKIAASFILVLTAALIDQVAAIAASADATLGKQFGVFLVLAALLGICAMMMTQALHIGTALVQGGGAHAVAMPSRLTAGGLTSTATKAGKAGAQGGIQRARSAGGAGTAAWRQAAQAGGTIPQRAGAASAAALRAAIKNQKKGAES